MHSRHGDSSRACRGGEPPTPVSWRSRSCKPCPGGRGQGGLALRGEGGQRSSREPLGAMGCCITLHPLTQVGAHPGVLAQPTTQTSPGPQQPCWLCGWADPTLLTGQETWPSGFSGFDSWEMVVPRGEPGSAEVLGEPHPSAGQRSPKAAGAASPERGGGGERQAGIQWGEGAGETQEPAFDLVDWVLYFSPLILELAKRLLEIAVIHQWHR